jgi:chromosomal replication initiation ATPase DnaA
VTSRSERTPQGPLDPDQLTFELHHPPSHAEDDFITGDGNRLALARIRAYPDWPEPVTILTGPAASGKSHLARIFAERSGARLIGPDEIRAVLQTDAGTPLILEDADAPGVVENDLFHLLNLGHRTGRGLLLTARLPVAQWPVTTADVRSRLMRATAFELALTDDIALSQMFVKVLGDRQLRVDPRVIAYLVARMERSSAEVLALAETMDRLALARKTAINRSIAASALAQRRLERGSADDLDMTGNDDDE